MELASDDLVLTVHVLGTIDCCDDVYVLNGESADIHGNPV
jgi:hypothetical protein